jgi:N-acetylglucosaminyl-diphospho-decaprenol L-rhamnosyltransferase
MEGHAVILRERLVMRDVDVVIVTHESSLQLRECLDALEIGLQGLSASIAVEDNDSSDGSAAVAATWRHALDSGLSALVASGPNAGYGGGNNRAVARLSSEIPGKARWLLFLNPDAILLDPIAPIIAILDESPNIGCAGIAQVDPNGNTVFSWDEFPNPRLEWRKALRMHLLQRELGGYTRDRRVDWVMGSFLLVRRTAFEQVQGFDTRFQLYMEEVDLCHRLSQAGWETWFFHGYRYKHYRRTKSEPWREGLRWSSRRLYDEKWMGARDRILVTLALLVRWSRELVVARTREHRQLAWTKLVATLGLRSFALDTSRGASC